MLLKNYIVLYGNEIDIKLLSKSSGNPSTGRSPEYKFQVKLHRSDVSIGHINVRFGNDEKIVKYIGHIGYGIDQDYRGNKYSIMACELVRRVLREHEIEKVIITCNPDNHASRKTCDGIGARLIEIIDIPRTSDAYSDDETSKCRYEWKI